MSNRKTKYKFDFTITYQRYEIQYHADDDDYSQTCTDEMQHIRNNDLQACRTEMRNILFDLMSCNHNLLCYSGVCVRCNSTGKYMDVEDEDFANLDGDKAMEFFIQDLSNPEPILNLKSHWAI